MKLISLKQPPKVRSVWRAVLVGVVAQPLVVLLLSAVYWALRPFVWAAVYSEPYRPPPGPYPRQNGLAVALRELGRIERTLFILDWLQSVELRRRVHAGLNKGEARNALARAVFFNRLGEIRDRSFEQQRYRASGLNLVTAAIVLWNTIYLEWATKAINGHDVALLQYLSPLGWEHINLTGDYLWRSSAKIGAGKFRTLRPLQPA